MELKPISFSGGVKSISDDDLCASCLNCQYRPGDMSGCDKGWPGMEDENGYIQECVQFARTAEEQYAAERSKPVRRMYCTCCGGIFQGRQWANQDTGYGLGDCCVQYVRAKYSDDGTQTFEQCYGIEGIHYSVGTPA